MASWSLKDDKIIMRKVMLSEIVYIMLDALAFMCWLAMTVCTLINIVPRN